MYYAIGLGIVAALCFINMYLADIRSRMDRLIELTENEMIDRIWDKHMEEVGK